ncbi:unnamed protein product [Pocillopora meandrina]|uniref:G-protein coupled receptors family 1 profile domain-containing protein n=1 Tax=Pocillopora meandrina TaxID=46732 RepID=A0AAU9Y4V9_9CNID|nr:unnamed protein product [Pocillopora meandrina]
MYRLMENQHRSVPCFVRIVYANAFYICCGVAFMTLAVVSYERLIAVRLQVRYNAVFSSSRILRYMAFIWILNILFYKFAVGCGKAGFKRYTFDSLVHLSSRSCSIKHWNHFEFTTAFSTRATRQSSSI